MQVRIGLEEDFEGRSLAWALDLPGCFAYGNSNDSALLAMARAIPNYIDWLSAHTDRPWFSPRDIDIRLTEVWKDYFVDSDFQRAPQGTPINAWFQTDWKPLTVEETRHAEKLLEWGFSDLQEAFRAAPASLLDVPIPGERWTIRGILAHVGTTQWWLLDRLGLAGSARSELPKDPQERCQAMQARLLEVVPGLAGSEQVLGKAAELWSPRKLIRRSVWHLRDHAGHIQRLAAEGPGGA